MGQNLQRWQPPSTSSSAVSITDQKPISEMALQYSTSESAAIKQAEKLTAAWPNLNAHNPLGYVTTLAAVLQKYPLGVVEECCDPAHGLALEREFPPTPKAIADWCERRVKQHQGYIIWARKLAAEKAEEQAFSDDHRQTMLGRLSKLMHGLFDKEPQQQEAAE